MPDGHGIEEQTTPGWSDKGQGTQRKVFFHDMTLRHQCDW